MDLKYICPICHTAILSRRVEFCPQCHSKLPADFLLSDNEKDKLDKETGIQVDQAQLIKKLADKRYYFPLSPTGGRVLITEKGFDWIELMLIISALICVVLAFRWDDIFHDHSGAHPAMMIVAGVLIIIQIIYNYRDLFFKKD